MFFSFHLIEEFILSDPELKDADCSARFVQLYIACARFDTCSLFWNVIYNTFVYDVYIIVQYLSHSDRYASELRKSCILMGKLNDSPAGGQVQTLRYYYS